MSSLGRRWVPPMTRGLIDESALAATGAIRHLAGHLDLATVCGFERVMGRLAVRHNRVSATKAALLDLARPATAHEIADRTGYAYQDVATGFSTCRSIVGVAYGRWAAHPDPQFVVFAQAARRLADVDGIIDAEALAAAAADGGFADQLDGFIEYVGYVRHGALIAVTENAVTAVRAALAAAGGYMTVAEVAAATGLSDEAAGEALRGCKGARYSRAQRSWEAYAPPAAALRGASLRRDPVLGACIDDVGLIDETCLRQATASTAPLETLVKQHGLTIVEGRLAITDTNAVKIKATLLGLGRAASAGELADRLGLAPKAASRLIESIDSIIATPRRLWVVDTDNNLKAFAEAAASCCDEAGLIDEYQLRRITALDNDTFEELAARLGLVRIGSRLAADSVSAEVPSRWPPWSERIGRRLAVDSVSARVTAALLDFDRPAMIAEIAQHTGLEVADIVPVLARTLPVCPVNSGIGGAGSESGAAVWVAEAAADGIYSEFAAALRLCSDEVGLIDEPQLEALAAERDWPMPLGDLIEACHLVRLSERLARANTAAAAAKAALLDKGPASIEALAEATGHSYSSIANAFARCESVRRISSGVRGAQGQFDAVAPTSFLTRFLVESAQET